MVGEYTAATSDDFPLLLASPATQAPTASHRLSINIRNSSKFHVVSRSLLPAPPTIPRKAAYCIVLSDTPEACLAARAAGMRTVGVASEGEAVDEALEAAADGASRG